MAKKNSAKSQANSKTRNGQEKETSEGEPSETPKNGRVQDGESFEKPGDENESRPDTGDGNGDEKNESEKPGNKEHNVPQTPETPSNSTFDLNPVISKTPATGTTSTGKRDNGQGDVDTLTPSKISEAGGNSTTLGMHESEDVPSNEGGAELRISKPTVGQDGSVLENAPPLPDTEEEKDSTTLPRPQGPQVSYHDNDSAGGEANREERKEELRKPASISSTSPELSERSLNISKGNNSERNGSNAGDGASPAVPFPPSRFEPAVPVSPLKKRAPRLGDSDEVLKEAFNGVDNKLKLNLTPRFAAEIPLNHFPAPAVERFNCAGRLNATMATTEVETIIEELNARIKNQALLTISKQQVITDLNARIRNLESQTSSAVEEEKSSVAADASTISEAKGSKIHELEQELQDTKAMIQSLEEEKNSAAVDALTKDAKIKKLERELQNAEAKIMEAEQENKSAAADTSTKDTDIQILKQELLETKNNLRASEDEMKSAAADAFTKDTNIQKLKQELSETGDKLKTCEQRKISTVADNSAGITKDTEIQALRQELQDNIDMYEEQIVRAKTKMDSDFTNQYSLLDIKYRSFKELSEELEEKLMAQEKESKKLKKQIESYNIDEREAELDRLREQTATLQAEGEGEGEGEGEDLPEVRPSTSSRDNAFHKYPLFEYGELKRGNEVLARMEQLSYSLMVLDCRIADKLDNPEKAYAIANEVSMECFDKSEFEQSMRAGFYEGRALARIALTVDEMHAWDQWGRARKAFNRMVINIHDVKTAEDDAEFSVAKDWLHYCAAGYDHCAPYGED